MIQKVLLLEKWKSLAEALGKIGPDGGITLLAEELPNVGRIDVERKIKVGSSIEYFSVTIILYNILLHTAYFQDWNDVLEHTTSTMLVIQTMSN